MTQEPRKTNAQKLCPLLNINRCAHLIDQHCLGSDCAWWVNVRKESLNPAYLLVYEGCGLVRNVPWKAQRVEELGA